MYKKNKDRNYLRKQEKYNKIIERHNEMMNYLKEGNNLSQQQISELKQLNQLLKSSDHDAIKRIMEKYKSG